MAEIDRRRHTADGKIDRRRQTAEWTVVAQAFQPAGRMDAGRDPRRTGFRASLPGTTSLPPPCY